MHLPSQCSLRDYTHHTKANPGFSSEVDSQLCHATGLDESEERDRHVLLIVDEMHIEEDLVFDKHSGSIKYNFFSFVLTTLLLITGELIGFTNLNDLREQMTLLEKTVTQSTVPSHVIHGHMVIHAQDNQSQKGT